MHHALLHCCIGFMHAMTDLAISAFAGGGGGGGGGGGAGGGRNIKPKEGDLTFVNRCTPFTLIQQRYLLVPVQFSTRAGTFCQCLRLHHHICLCSCCRSMFSKSTQSSVS